MPGLTVVAVNVIVLPEHTAGLSGVIVIDGTSIGLTVIVIPVLVAVEEVTQVTLLVSVQVITSLLLRVEDVYVLPVPTELLFFFHTYVGEAPPLVGVAVNVVDVPAHIVEPGLTLTETAGVTFGFTVMNLGVLVTLAGYAQVALLVIVQVTELPLLSVLVVYVLLLVPTGEPLTFHA